MPPVSHSSGVQQQDGDAKALDIQNPHLWQDSSQPEPADANARLP